MDAIECKVSFGRELNPELDPDGMSSRRKGVYVVKAMNTIRGFMYSEVRPEFRNHYPPNGVELHKSFTSSDKEALVNVDIYLTAHDDMFNISQRLQGRLIQDLILNLPDIPADQIIVSVGPAMSRTAA